MKEEEEERKKERNKMNSSIKTVNYDIKLLHRIITLYCGVVLIFWIMSGAVTVPIFKEGMYFGLKPPIEIIGGPLRSWGIFIFISFVLVVSQLATVVTERVMISISNADEDYMRKNFNVHPTAMKYVLRVHKAIMTFFQYSTVVIFIKSQVSFFMAIAITDVVAVMVTTFVTMQIKNILKDDWWKDMLPYILCVNTLLMPLFPLILWLSGAQKVGYFNLGPPIHIFGDTLNTIEEVVFLTIFLFFDRMLETFSSENIDQWINNILENSQKTYSANIEIEEDDDDDDEDEDEDDEDDDEDGNKKRKKKRRFDVQDLKEEDMRNMLIAFFVFLVRGFVQWMRNIFIINFFFDRYDIIAIYMAADAIAGCIHIYRKDLKQADKDTYFVASLEPGSRALLVTLSLCQTVEMIILLFVLILGRWDLSTYFTFDNPDYFGLPLDTTLKVNVITALAVFFRLFQTIYNRVILPDFYHYTYSDLQRYTDTVYWAEVMFNTLMTSSVHWVGYMFTVQLITATSLKFVTIFILVDIPVSILIVIVYIWKKARMLRNIEYIKIVNKQSNYIIVSHQQTLGISSIPSSSQTKSTSKSKSKQKQKQKTNKYY